jgi:DNA-binding NarL/FixJ family response regulator
MPSSPAPETTITAPLRVIVVDDDADFLSAVGAAIRSAADLALQGTASNCAQARALLTGEPADVLLLDLGLPDGPGAALIAETQRAWPRCLVMVSTVFGDEAHVIQSLEAGAIGYLLKDSDGRHILEEIRSAAAGGSPISPLIARQLLSRFNRQPAAAPVANAGRLSPREQEVLEFITKGFSYEEIAALMGVSRNTVLSFVRRIYAKLDVRSQTEAIYEARRQGLLA